MEILQSLRLRNGNSQLLGNLEKEFSWHSRMVELESDPFAIKFAFGIPSSQRLRATTSTYNNSKHIVMGVHAELPLRHIGVAQCCIKSSVSFNDLLILSSTDSFSYKGPKYIDW